MNKTLSLLLLSLMLTGCKLSVDIEGQGSVAVASASDPDLNFTCTPENAPCAENFAPFNLVTLKAEAAEDYIFTGWEGACESAMANCEVTMAGEKQTKAIFVEDPGLPQIGYATPHVVYTNKTNVVTLRGTNMNGVELGSFTINDQTIHNVELIDDTAVKITLPEFTEPTQANLQFTFLDSVSITGPEISIRNHPEYEETVLTIPGRVESMFWDTDREAFYGVFWDLNYGASFRAARIIRTESGWRTDHIAVVNPRAITLSSDSREILVSDTSCNIQHLNADTLEHIKTEPVGSSCHVTTIGTLHALDDGQVLYADTNQWGSVNVYQEDNKPTANSGTLRSIKSRMSLYRNKMLVAEGPTSTGTLSMWVYDSLTNQFSYLKSGYFLAHLINVSGDGSRISHYQDLYDENLQHLGVVGEGSTSSINHMGLSPDGKMAVVYDYNSRTITPYDISGTEAPFPATGPAIELDSNLVANVIRLFITEDNRYAFLFTIAGVSDGRSFNMIVKEIP